MGEKMKIRDQKSINASELMEVRIKKGKIWLIMIVINIFSFHLIPKCQII